MESFRVVWPNVKIKKKKKKLWIYKGTDPFSTVWCICSCAREHLGKENQILCLRAWGCVSWGQEAPFHHQLRMGWFSVHFSLTVRFSATLGAGQKPRTPWRLLWHQIKYLWIISPWAKTTHRRRQLTSKRQDNCTSRTGVRDARLPRYRATGGGRESLHFCGGGRRGW